MSTDWADHSAIRCDHSGCVATGHRNLSDLITGGWRIDFTGDGRDDHHDCCPTHASECQLTLVAATRRCIVHDQIYVNVCSGCRADEIAAEESA